MLDAYRAERAHPLPEPALTDHQMRLATARLLGAPGPASDHHPGHGKTTRHGRCAEQPDHEQVEEAEEHECRG